MKKYAIICTRSEKTIEEQKSFDNLVNYFTRVGVEKVQIMENQDSIFEGYQTAISNLPLNNNDIIIFCHDDIDILTDPVIFTTILEQNLNNSKVGFVGLAGTSILKDTACWWDREVWQSGGLRGMVFHGDYLKQAVPTIFGPYGKAVVMDGVFLAIKYKNLKKIILTKPQEFVGKWDFYDLYYTFQSYQAGFINLTVPIIICHRSPGLGATKPDWDENRKAFKEIFKLKGSISV